MLRRPAPVIALGAMMAAAGLAMIQWGRTLPPFIDHDQARAAFAAWCSATGGIDQAMGERYRSLLTARYDWINLGVGIGFTGLIAALWAAFLSNRRRAGEPWLRTPRDRLSFFLLGWFAIAWSWLGNMSGLAFDQERMQFPICADSIGIPAAALTQIALTAAVVLTVPGLGVAVGFGLLPVALAVASVRGRGLTWGVNAASLLVAALVITIGSSMAMTADAFGAPAYLVMLYLIASARAALLAPR